jgi:hypothetical protein
LPRSKSKIDGRKTLTDKIGPTRLFRNLKTGERFLAARQPNDYVVYAVMDENNKPINAGNRLSKDEFAAILGVCDIEADENTVNYTFIGGKFVERKRLDRH